MQAPTPQPSREPSSSRSEVGAELVAPQQDFRKLHLVESVATTISVIDGDDVRLLPRNSVCAAVGGQFSFGGHHVDSLSADVSEGVAAALGSQHSNGRVGRFLEAQGGYLILAATTGDMASNKKLLLEGRRWCRRAGFGAIHQGIEGRVTRISEKNLPIVALTYAGKGRSIEVATPNRIVELDLAIGAKVLVLNASGEMIIVNGQPIGSGVKDYMRLVGDFPATLVHLFSIEDLRLLERTAPQHPPLLVCGPRGKTIIEGLVPFVRAAWQIAGRQLGDLLLHNAVIPLSPVV